MKKSNKQYDYTFKIVLVGDSGVGKSCILLRWADDTFNENFYATIGVDFRFKNFDYEGKSIRLQIWDTAGQERFKTITSAYYRGADAIIIVYDISDRNSFVHVKDWLDQVNKYSTDEPVKLILGNKIDLESKKEVNQSDIDSIQNQTGINVVEVSAKDKESRIKDVVDILSRKLIERFDKRGNVEFGKKIGLNERKEENKNCC